MRYIDKLLKPKVNIFKEMSNGARLNIFIFILSILLLPIVLVVYGIIIALGLMDRLIKLLFIRKNKED